MVIVHKIRDSLYKDNDGYYSFKQIVNLGKNKPLPIKIEHQRGEKMRWNPDMMTPFDYGESPNHLNLSDDMAWDIIIAPSSNTTDKNLLIAGVVRIGQSAEDIPFPNGNVKGNHKLILANNGVITDKDKKDIADYFAGNNVFEKPDFFDIRSSERVIEEDWERSTFNKMKLGNFNNGIYGGIAVGPTARRMEGSKNFKNKMPITNPNSTRTYEP